MESKTIIAFGCMTRDEQQAFADFQLKELIRHENDCEQIRKDLEFMKETYGIEPRRIYAGKWIEVKE